MAKRVKLLSVMVAAVLCFTAGIAIMFGSNKTAKAEVEVPTLGYSDQRVDLDWSTGKNFDGISIGVRGGLATDWAVLEYYVPAGATRASAASITFTLADKASGDVAGPSGTAEADGVIAKTAYAVAADSAYVSNATEQDVKVVLAIDMVNGKVYGSVADAEFEEIASFANIAYVSASASKIPFWTVPASALKRLNNVKIYTEEGVVTEYKAGNPGNVHHGAGSFNADKISSINYPSNLVKPSAINAYTASGSVKMMNTAPTASDWIFMEYTVSAATEATASATDPNAFMTVLSNNGYQGHEPSSANANYVGVLHNNVSAYVQGEMRNLFTPVGGADTDVKIAINTKTGLMVTYINGELYQSKHQYAEAANLTGADRYYYIGSNSSTVSGVLKNVVVYDGNGIDLGLTTNMVEGAPEVDADKVNAIAGKDLSAQSSFWFATKTATTSKWIILEWTNGEGNTTDREGNGGWTWGVALGDQSLDGVTASEANIWHDFGTTYLGAATAGKDMKVAVNTETGVITVYVDGLAKESSTRSVAGLSAVKFRTGNNAYPILNSTVYGLKAYDENGNDLGIETNMGKVIPAVENVTAQGKDYIGKGGFSVVNEKATNSEWVFFEFDNLAESTVVDEGQCRWYQSVQDANASVYVSNASFANGIANQYNGGAYASTVFNNATGATVHTIVAIDTTTGTSYVSKDGGAFSLVMAFNGAGAKGDFPNSEKAWYAGFCVNAGNQGVRIENLKCYDIEGNDLGVVTSLSEVVEGTIKAETYYLGVGNFPRWQGNVYFVDANGNDRPAAAIGDIAAKKFGTEDVTLKFSSDGALQLFGYDDNGYESCTGVDEWFLVEEGTVFGNVVLNEDLYIVIKGSQMDIFKATKEFAINYEGVGEATNPNPTTRTFDQAVEIANIDDPYFLDWSVASIDAYTLGDVTVTANWMKVELTGYKLIIKDNLSLVIDAINTGCMSLTAEFTYGDAEPVVVSMNHYANLVPGRMLLVDFTFDGVLPQHLNDDVVVEIMNGADVLETITINVADYLNDLVAKGAEDAELAQDVLYYGAAAQLYTGHDVENIVADLSDVVVEVPEDADVYAKAGEKDESYYWKSANVVYDNTVKLVVTFAGKADYDSVAVLVDNAGVTAEVAAVEVATGLFEIAIDVPATQFGNAITFTIMVDGEAVGQVLTYSVNSYIVNVETANAAYATLLDMLYKYGASANALANA